MRTVKATIAALLPNADALSSAVLALGAAGIAVRADVRIACTDASTQSRLVDRLGVSALSDAGSGNVEQALETMQLSPPRAAYFANELAGERVLVALQNARDGARIAELLAAHGADFGPADLPDTSTRDARIPLREERAHVQKYLLEVGRVNVHREVTTELARFEVELEREDLVIERTPPGGAMPEITRIPVLREDVVVSKRTVVENQVRVRRERFSEVRQIETVLRREEPHVSISGDVSLDAE